MARRERLFVLNDPHALRISAALAMEIGLNESIVLLQLEFLISISENVRDGRVWTYQSLTDLQERHFPFWSRQTIMRAIKELEKRELITIATFNRAGFDKTQWYSLNPQGIARLASVRLEQGSTTVFQNGTSTFQDAPSASQDGTSMSQNGTAIPKTTDRDYTEKSAEPEYKIPSTPEEYAAWERERERQKVFIRSLEGWNTR